MFLVKKEESRNFDVCFRCFLVFRREKKCIERLGRRRISKKKNKIKCVLSNGCLGLFIASGTFFEVRALVGPPASNLLHPWIDLHFQFLKRYGTQKSNGQIKSYGSGKLSNAVFTVFSISQLF